MKNDSDAPGTSTLLNRNGSSTMLTILFLCHGNSCRSQMAEGWARHLKEDVLDPLSAGEVADGVDPLAVLVMKEAGVDIAGHRSKTIADLSDRDVDVVITLCDTSHKQCPAFPGSPMVVHHAFDDPPILTKGLDRGAALAVYRRVRDEIRDYVRTLPGSLPAKPGDAIPPPLFDSLL